MLDTLTHTALPRSKCPQSGPNMGQFAPKGCTPELAVPHQLSPRPDRVPAASRAASLFHFSPFSNLLSLFLITVRWKRSRTKFFMGQGVEALLGIAWYCKFNDSLKLRAPHPPTTLKNKAVRTQLRLKIMENNSGIGTHFIRISHLYSVVYVKRGF